jgi:hypothetical protein
MLNGHPQVYCRVLIDILLEHGASVTLATGDIENFEKKWPDLQPFTNRANVTITSTSEKSVGGIIHLSAQELMDLQSELSIDATIFTVPEFFRDEFIKIGRGQVAKLHGKNIGIFGATTKWYPGEDPYTGESLSSIGNGVRSKLSSIKSKVWKYWTTDKYFFETILLRKKVLDTVIVKDERVIEKFGDNVEWLPEIFKVFNFADSADSNREFESTAPQLKKFLRDTNPNDLVIFFGSGAWYKGYDYFLQMLIKDESSVGIHLGAEFQADNKRMFEGNPILMRKQLAEQGRLFQNNSFVESQKLIDYAFGCCRRFVSTHRLTLSSGTMLQALDYGMPVLVPDTGLVGQRVKNNGLGMTYRYGNVEDLVRQWKNFKMQPIEEYQSNISVFMNRFSRKEIERLLLRVL